MIRRGRALLAAIAVALAAYAALGAAATVRHERSIHNVFDEMALEGPMAKPQLPFPWIRGTMSFPPELRYAPDPSYDKWSAPPITDMQYTYTGDLGEPWDGMERSSGDRSYASIDIMDDGVTARCSTRDGVTADGLAFSAEFSWSYDPATHTLSWEQYFVTWEPAKEDDSRGWDYNRQFYHSLAREEWLAATGVDGARLDAWVDRTLGLGIRGWLAQNAGRTRFSAADLGDFNLAGDDVGRLRSLLGSLGETI
ncbi:hypothetical protein [Olsenella profusa]|uniref:Uncharacterized protein n=1 Tax=Olsenella profusa F0195 TaxID=1125712 RepID=U2TPW6_9ACTN|nr:hypothetical protein [Olsenella profusa]ERL08480.1 hypothetical protein HMPREF1316_1986 [Olsenella profusa F0195]